jgi:hypothetical protein
MALDWRSASINFGQGVDTQSDPKLVIAGKLTALQDGVFTNTRRISKRNGYDSMTLSIAGGGTLSNPKLVHAYGEQLVCVDDTYLYTYSQSLNRWVRSGKCDSIGVSRSFASGASVNELNSSSVIFGNYLIVSYDCWSDVRTAGNHTDVKLSVFDLSSGATLCSDVTVQSTISAEYTCFGKVIVIAGTTPAVVYWDSHNASLCLNTITISTSGVTLGALVVLSNEVQFYGDGAVRTWPAYDAVGTSAAAVIAYSSTASGNPIKYAKIDTSGSITASQTVTSTGLAFPINIVVDPTNENLWTYYATPSSTSAPSTNSALNYLIRDISLASVLAKTTIQTGIDYVRQVTALSTSTTQQTFFYSESPYVQTGASTGPTYMYNPVVRTGTVTSAGVITGPGALKFNADIFGRPFSQSGKSYLPITFPSPDQNTNFLLDVSDGHIAAQFCQGVSESKYTSTTAPNMGGKWWRYPGYLANFSQFNSTQRVSSAGQVLQDDYYQGFLVGTSVSTLDWACDDAYQALEANNVLVTNGSVVTQFDGVNVTEVGFLEFPEMTATFAVGGGFITNGTYIYQCVYQWSDAQGNLRLSGASDGTTITVSGAASNATITLKIKKPNLSRTLATANPPVLNIYRTSAGGTNPSLLIQIPMDDTSATYTYTDTAGSISASAPLIYTAGGAVLSNGPTPPAMILWLNGTRLWMVDAENPQTDAYYSKTFAKLTAISMASELLYAADPRGGSVTGASAMDEKTVILKQRGAQYFIGDGANDAGTGSTLTPPQVIPSDVGCENSRGVILVPDGVIFRAANDKGIYLVSRAVQVGYFGAPVQAYNSQDIQAASFAPSGTQLRFLTSSGYSLVYDYFFGQWGTFTNHAGLSSTVWNGLYVYLRADGSIYKENPTSFLDGSTAYSLSATLAWIKADNAQNYERVRLFEMLGDYRGVAGHGLAASVAYDFGTSFTAMDNFLFVDADGSFQYRAFLPRQKCDAVQLRLTEITTGVSGEYIDLSDLGIEIGIKRGLNKLPAADTVG